MERDCVRRTSRSSLKYAEFDTSAAADASRTAALLGSSQPDLNESILLELSEPKLRQND
jgi:hypothetical protein